MREPADVKRCSNWKANNKERIRQYNASYYAEKVAQNPARREALRAANLARYHATRNAEKDRARQMAWRAAAKDNLSDSYVRKALRDQGWKGPIPAEVVSVKRVQYQIKRYVNQENGNENNRRVAQRTY